MWYLTFGANRHFERQGVLNQFITSVGDVSGGLFVCQHNCGKTIASFFMKLGRRVQHRPRKNPYNFGADSCKSINYFHFFPTFVNKAFGLGGGPRSSSALLVFLMRYIHIFQIYIYETTLNPWTLNEKDFFRCLWAQSLWSLTGQPVLSQEQQSSVNKDLWGQGSGSGSEFIQQTSIRLHKFCRSLQFFSRVIILLCW